MGTRRDNKKTAKLAEEAIWFERGREAWYAGLELKDWPKPEGEQLKYSRYWYRIKTAWQDGWRTAYGKPISEFEEDIKSPKSLKDRLYLLILKGPITVRQVLRTLSSADYQQAKQILKDWEEQGAIKKTGKGIKGNPVTIELCND